MEDVGRWWLLLHGWKREYRLWTRRGWVIVDLAHPKLKLALEGDGFQYHMDVVREQERNEALEKRGWTVRHYRYQRLRYQPGQVRREVRQWYWQALLWKARKHP
jgi:very-short-patch-repair endonuclease